MEIEGWAEVQKEVRGYVYNIWEHITAEQKGTTVIIIQLQRVKL